jgi:hypothetical protein
MPRLLELFSGTGSVGSVFRERGCEVVALDRDMEADLRVDVMDWDYTVYPRGHFDIVWASPPCTEYSVAKTVGVRRIDEANAIVQRTLEIIDYFGPRYFVIENPQTGHLKRQAFMRDIPYTDVDYCRYGMPYRKRTRLWTNLKFTPRPLCRGDCSAAVGGRHLSTAQQGGHTSYDGDRRFRRAHLYMVPRELVSDISAELFP